MSGIALLDQDVVTAASRRLAADLAGGRWHERHGYLLERGELDLGYRLVATRLARKPARPATIDAAVPQMRNLPTGWA
jgi:hypothetical protein